MFGFLCNWFFVLIGLWISWTKTQTLPNLRPPTSSVWESRAGTWCILVDPDNNMCKLSRIFFAPRLVWMFAVTFVSIRNACAPQFWWGWSITNLLQILWQNAYCDSCWQPCNHRGPKWQFYIVKSSVIVTFVYRDNFIWSRQCHHSSLLNPNMVQNMAGGQGEHLLLPS